MFPDSPSSQAPLAGMRSLPARSASSGFRFRDEGGGLRPATRGRAREVRLAAPRRGCHYKLSFSSTEIDHRHSGEGRNPVTFFLLLPLRVIVFHDLPAMLSLSSALDSAIPPALVGTDPQGGSAFARTLVPTGLMPRLALARITPSKNRMRAEGAPYATPYPEEAAP